MSLSDSEPESLFSNAMHLEGPKNPLTPMCAGEFEGPLAMLMHPSGTITGFPAFFASRRAARAPCEATDLVTRHVEGASHITRERSRDRAGYTHAVA